MLIKAFVHSIFWMIIVFIGYLIFKSKKSPSDLVLGLPLIIIGFGFIMNLFWSALLSLFSPTFNKEVCMICSKKEDY